MLKGYGCGYVEVVWGIVYVGCKYGRLFVVILF